jgi:hypothetical protein
MDFNNLGRKFYTPLLGIAAAGQGLKILGGIGQAIFGARKIKRALRDRPSYEIPAEYQQNVKLADKMMNMGMPREQYLAQMQGITRNQNFGLRALGDRRSALAGVANIVQAGNDNILQLNATDASMRNQNMRAGTGMKMNANYQLGMQKIAKMQWDKFNPYMVKLQQGQAMLGAGLQNIAGGADGASQLGMMGMAYGGGGGGNTQAPTGGTEANYDFFNTRRSYGNLGG